MDGLKRYLVEEVVEDYAAGRLSRRDALKHLVGLTGAALALHMLDAVAQPAPAIAAGGASGAVPNRVAPDDPAIKAGAVKFDGGDAQLLGYAARPARAGRHPIVLVCQENRGLTPHIADVTRRVAKAGYLGLAVDLLSREGGTANVESDRIPALLGNAPPERAVQDFRSGLAFARAEADANGDRIGMVGFCYGGGVTWRVAAAVPEMRAAVPFYGQPIPAADVPKVHAAVLAIYAGRDARINAMIPAIETAMEQNHKTYRKIIYPDVDHAFYNDTGDRYNAAAAKAAWDETTAWFARYLAA